MRQELLAKMRQRKDANKEKNKKKVKTVSTTGDREAPYDLEKVLKELGEVSLQKSIFYCTILFIINQIFFRVILIV